MNELFAALAVFWPFIPSRLFAHCAHTWWHSSVKHFNVALFSIVSLGLLVWLGVAYANAPYLETGLCIPELKWLMLLIMPIACLFIVSGLTSRNPFSLGMGSKYFDSAKPGIVGLTKHPAIWGLAI